jgi:hypothetical protein
MLGGADFEPALRVLRQLTDGYASHAINDITAINDINLGPTSKTGHGFTRILRIKSKLVGISGP